VKEKVLTVYRRPRGYAIGLGNKEIITILCEDTDIIECVKLALRDLPLEYQLESEDY
jgi:hypothetical protein